MSTYSSEYQLAEWLNIGDLDDNTRLTVALEAAKRGIDLWCGRTFTTDTVASARYFYPQTWTTCPIDDAWEVSSVATDNAEDGTYGTVWAAGDWMAAPVGGIGPAGTTGWAYTSIVAVESREFSQTRRPYVKVTAKWGWADTPADIHLASLLFAAELFKLHEAPLGTSWTGEGVGFTIRQNRPLRDLLTPYRKQQTGDGRFMVA